MLTPTQRVLMQGTLQEPLPQPLPEGSQQCSSPRPPPGAGRPLGFSAGGVGCLCGARGCLGPEDGGQGSGLLAAELGALRRGRWRWRWAVGSPELGFQGRGSRMGMKNRKRAATSFQQEQTPGGRVQTWGSQPCLAQSRPSHLSPQNPITVALVRGPRRKARPRPALPISMESQLLGVGDHKPGMAHAVPQPAPCSVHRSPQIPSPPHPTALLPARRIHSQGKALAANIQTSECFLNRGSGLRARGRSHIQENCLPALTQVHGLSKGWASRTLIQAVGRPAPGVRTAPSLPP